MKNTIAYIILTGATMFSFYFGGCNYNNVEKIKTNSTNTWTNAGYTVVGYEGYQIGNILGNPGGRVWYVVSRNGITYEGYLSKWGNEYHIYSLKALDAIPTARE